MSRDEPAGDAARRQRLLEVWLPLAREASLRYGWDLEPPALEALVIAAAPALGQARSAFEACAILWVTYARISPDEPTP